MLSVIALVIISVKTGIEKFYENKLHGQIGYMEVENDASGRAIRTLHITPNVPGTTLYLTIDSQLQLVAEQALGPHPGAIIAIAPQSGQVLAMVSKPSFDPNAFITGMSHEYYQTLLLGPDKPLYHRALRGLYPFGSTIKPFLALGALNDGIISPHYTIYDPGWF